MDTISKVGFGGGCHWCTEAVFLSLRGVSLVAQGFIASQEANSSYSEAVIVSYDPNKISLKDLLSVHLHTHKSTVAHSMRKKYVSAVYVFEEQDINDVKNTLESLQGNFIDPIITQVLLFGDFKPSESQFHNYYYSNPDKPFCETYIVPKLEKLRTDFSELLKGANQ